MYLYIQHKLDYKIHLQSHYFQQAVLHRRVQVIHNTLPSKHPNTSKHPNIVPASLKGVVQLKLLFHPFTTHRLVNVGSGDIF